MSRLRVSKWRVRTKVSMRNPYRGKRIRRTSFKSILRKQRLKTYTPRCRILKPRIRKFRIRKF